MGANHFESPADAGGVALDGHVAGASLMCGVIACRTADPALPYVRAGLERLEYRGYDSVGVAVQTTTGDVARLRTVGRVRDLDRVIQSWDGERFGEMAIGHTRWATHGGVTENNAHPHVDCSGRVHLVHNGIVENAEELRTDLRAAGHRISTTVDSEVLCHLIEDELATRGDLFDSVEAALGRVRGSWALAVIDGVTGQLVVAAHRSPLLVVRSARGDFATSDVAAIAEWTDEFRALDDGDVVELGGSHRWRRHGVPATPVAPTPCTWRTEDVALDDYPDYMAKEIDEQPEAAAKLIDAIGAEVASGALWNALDLPPFDRVRVIGCGTSLNAGMVIAKLVRALGGVPTDAIVASEADEEIAEDGQLCLAISQSGETADLLAALTSGLAEKSPLLALVNNTHSTLARRADAVVACGAGPEIGVAATKTFVCQIIAGAAVMISALVATERLSRHGATLLADELRRIPDQLAAAGTVAKRVIPPLVERLGDAPGFLFIARGLGVPYAAEGALKLKELSYRWAEHHPAGELKHGPLALITDGTPVVVIDDGGVKLATNVAEVSARGARVVAIGGPGSTVPVLDGAHLPWGPLAATVPLQTLARAIALTSACDVDKPRNLAKSVTVE